jgi:hypothetical protein
MAELLPDEVNHLIRLINEVFEDYPSLGPFTKQAFNVKLADICAQMALPLAAAAIVSWAESNGELRSLLATMISERPNRSDLQFYCRRILDRLDQAARDPLYVESEDPHDTCFVAGPRECSAFVARQALREFIRDIAGPRGASIFIVNGPSETGKTYSAQLLTYVRTYFKLKDRPTYKLASIDVSKHDLATFDPITLAKEIACRVSWDPATIPERTSPRSFKDVCRWLIEKASSGAQRVVVALDGVNALGRYSEAFELVQELITVVSTNDTNIKLVVLNFRIEDLPETVANQVSVESVSQLTEGDVKIFFATLYEQKKGQAPDIASIDKIAVRVMRDLQEGMPHFNRSVNLAVSRAAKMLA